MSHDFLRQCTSRPKMLAELKTGEKFIFFPDDGDDSGHGGFWGACQVFVKIEPTYPGKPYHESFRWTCRAYDRPEELVCMPLNYPVIPLRGLL